VGLERTVSPPARGGGGQNSGLRRDHRRVACDGDRTQHDWPRVEGPGHPRLVVRRGSTARRRRSNPDRKRPNSPGNPAQLVEPTTMGDPMRPLMWVSKSHAKLAAALREMDHKISAGSNPKMLGLLKYRRQVNRKSLEGSHNPDRNAQFEHINAAVLATQAAGQPVISIDT